MRVPVAIGLPNGGSLDFEMAQAVFVGACKDRTRVIAWIGGRSSHSGDSFNSCLLNALDLRDAGKVTHFAMVHSDVVPAFGWLDTMYREMESRGDMLISACIAIKSPCGEASTAIGPVDDPWRVRRRIRLDERATLPTTFNLADIPDADPGRDALLVNNGLLLTDLRHPFWDAFEGFDSRSRIGRDPGTNRRRSEFRPEDWELGRALHRSGAPYSATWAVPVRHVGAFGWPNVIELPEADEAIAATP